MHQISTKRIDGIALGAFLRKLCDLISALNELNDNESYNKLTKTLHPFIVSVLYYIMECA
jgi:hypothetical protein